MTSGITPGGVTISPTSTKSKSRRSTLSIEMSVHFISSSSRKQVTDRLADVAVDQHDQWCGARLRSRHGALDRPRHREQFAVLGRTRPAERDRDDRVGVALEAFDAAPQCRFEFALDEFIGRDLQAHDRHVAQRQHRRRRKRRSSCR